VVWIKVIVNLILYITLGPIVFLVSGLWIIPQLIKDTKKDKRWIWEMET